MKTSRIILALSLVALTSIASAKTPDTESSVLIKGSANVQKSYVSPEEFRDLQGSYALDNGQTLRVSQIQNRYFAQIGTQEKLEVIPTSSEVFVAKDNSVKLQFKASTLGAPTTVKASYLDNSK